MELNNFRYASSWVDDHDQSLRRHYISRFFEFVRLRLFHWSPVPCHPFGWFLFRLEPASEKTGKFSCILRSISLKDASSVSASVRRQTLPLHLLFEFHFPASEFEAGSQPTSSQERHDRRSTRSRTLSCPTSPFSILDN